MPYGESPYAIIHGLGIFPAHSMAPQSIRYRIFPKHPGAHLFEVSCVIASPDPAGQKLRLPTWIPGSYMIREFAKHIVQLKAESDGRPLETQKLDKNTWQCAPVQGTLSVSYEVYAWDLSVRAAHLDHTHGFFNGSSVFLAVAGQEDRVHEVEILPPDGDAYRGWRVATALPSAGADAYGFGLYRAENYDELIDHPVEMGTFTLAQFEACGVPHDVAITGRHRCDLKRLSADLTTICEHHIRFFGEPPPMERYLFLVMAVGDGYGGLEHRASTALVCSRDDLPRPGETERSEKYRTFLGLASHEYFHTWNVKRIKPAAFVPYDLSRENYTRLLWAFEGITSYYDDLALARSGLITQEQYLTLIAETVTRVLRGSGRHKQSIAESSFDAWIKYYRQDENTPNAVVNYYAKGSLVALALDLTVRRASAGSRSLDDVMSALWQRYGKQAIGVPEDGVETVAMEIAGTDLKKFFALAVYGTDDLPLGPLLAAFGIDQVVRAAEGAADKGGKTVKKDAAGCAALGVKVAENGEARLLHVYDGGAAQAAGLSAGDVVIALDGIKVSGSNLDARIAMYAAGAEVTIHAFRRDELMQFEVTLHAAAIDTCDLLLRKEASSEEQARREAWLGPTSAVGA
jgi:predicted metalloprotease with PDZ domain